MLASLPQGEKMSNSYSINFVDSILTVKASGSITIDAINDLDLPSGQAIAQLINEQEKKDK